MAAAPSSTPEANNCTITRISLVCSQPGLAAAGSNRSALSAALLPARPRLSRRFRRLFLAGLAQPLAGPALLDGALSGTHRARALAATPRRLARPRLGRLRARAAPGPHHVLTYLARSTHRVAIANHRLVALEAGQVTLRSKDSQHGHRLRTLTLEAVACLRRLMRHVPPPGCHRLRHMASWPTACAPGHAACRTLLGHAMPPYFPRRGRGPPAPDVSAAEPGSVCPVCQHGRMQRITTVYRQPAVGTCLCPPLDWTLHRGDRRGSLGLGP